MGLTGFSFELVSPVDPARMFKASVVDGHNLVPTIQPEVVSSAGILEGDGGPGSVRQFKFTEVIPFSHVEERIEVLDEDKLEYKFTMKEATHTGGRVISATYNMKIEPSADGGCICRTTAEYNTGGGVKALDEEINSGKEGVMGMFKAIETYLIQNPSAYS
ncbi:major allergen Pru ar 1-like [Magnolia sinica]|uniref:major allergen Pru ar 1-like n=1 Tax=Magnolia sinica TaxID=86752 RepID=UPI00265ACC28|nr:major allergen Pru ar 1-like [Magnolia sinica]